MGSEMSDAGLKKLKYNVRYLRAITILTANS